MSAGKKSLDPVGRELFALQGSIIQTAGALILDQQGMLLLGLRSADKRVAPSCWDIIGGHVEDGESLGDALVRELWEELGIRPTVFRLIASMQEPASGIFRGAVHHAFAVTAWQGEPTNACDEHVEIRWFSLAEVLGLANRTPFDFERLHDLARSSALPS